MPHFRQLLLFECFLILFISHYHSNGALASFLIRSSSVSSALVIVSWSSHHHRHDHRVHIRQDTTTTTTRTTATRINLYEFQNEENEHVLPLIQLAQAHFSSQALFTAVQLGIFDILGDTSKSMDDICSKLEGKPNEEALLRTLRLLVAVGILQETIENDNHATVNKFGLSPTGALLQTSHKSTSMASFVSHWTERAMWNAWSVLPDYVAGKIPADTSPFQAANNVTLVEYYHQHPKSAQHRNNVARFVSTGEIPAILSSYDWNSFLRNKIVVDIGGGYGDFMNAMASHCPNVEKCYCLDLPNVIDDAKPLDKVELVAGDMYDISTIPKCNVIFMKHVLCDWSDENAVSILQNCHAALARDGKVVLADALIASGDEAFNSRQVQAHIDALLMVVGSRMERSYLQLSMVAKNAGFEIDTVIETASPSVNITILSKV